MASKETITIVGVGALGSHVAQFIRNENVEIKIVDFDRVDAKNVLTQLHAKSNVGKAKVESLKQTFNFLFGTKLLGASAKLTKDNTAQLLGNSKLIIDCLDNGEARRLVQGFARKHSVPCLHGGLAADGTFGRVIWDSMFVIDDENVAGQATCEGGEHLAFIGVVSSLMARAVNEFLKTGKQTGFSVSPTVIIST